MQSKVCVDQWRYTVVTLESLKRIVTEMRLHHYDAVFIMMFVRHPRSICLLECKPK